MPGIATPCCYAAVYVLLQHVVLIQLVDHLTLFGLFTSQCSTHWIPAYTSCCAGKHLVAYCCNVSATHAEAVQQQAVTVQPQARRRLAGLQHEQQECW